MTKEEIREKAIECGKEMTRSNCCNSCTECEYGKYFYNLNVPCFSVYGYEHGFADGVEEGKKIALAEHDEGVRADERKKVLDEAYEIITSQMIKHGTELDFNIETQELLLQMKGD